MCEYPDPNKTYVPQIENTGPIATGKSKDPDFLINKYIHVYHDKNIYPATEQTQSQNPHRDITAYADGSLIAIKIKEKESDFLKAIIVLDIDAAVLFWNDLSKEIAQAKHIEELEASN